MPCLNKDGIQSSNGLLSAMPNLLKFICKYLYKNLIYIIKEFKKGEKLKYD